MKKNIKKMITEALSPHRENILSSDVIEKLANELKGEFDEYIIELTKEITESGESKYGTIHIHTNR